MNMEQIKKFYPILIFILIIILTFVIAHYRDNSDNNDSSQSCLMHKITLEELRGIASKEGIQVTQSDVDQINQKPLCRDFCLEQLDYSKKYDDWFAEEKLIKDCAG